MRGVAVKQELDERQGRGPSPEGVDRVGRACMRLAEASTQELEEALLLRREFSHAGAGD